MRYFPFLFHIKSLKPRVYFYFVVVVSLCTAMKPEILQGKRKIKKKEKENK